MAENKEIFVLTQMSEFDKSNDLNKQTDIIALQDGKNVRIDSEVISQQVINKVNPKFVERKEKGQPNGVATLDENGKVPNEQLPPLDFTVNEIPIDKQTPTPTQNGVFIPTQTGIYPNFGGLEYSQQEFDNQDDVRFIFIDGRFEKQVKSFGVEGEINSTDTRAVGGSKVYDYTLKEVKTIAELRTIVGEENQTIRLLGYYEAGDKPPLLYKWVSGVGEDDGGSVIISDGGYWSALFNDTIDSRDFGCFPNKGDVSENFNKAFDKHIELKKELKFIGGEFILNTIKNLANNNTNIIGEEGLKTVFKNTSSKEKAFIIDAFEDSTPDTPFVNNLFIKNILFAGNENTKIVCFIHGIARSNFIGIYAKDANEIDGIGFSLNSPQLCNFTDFGVSTQKTKMDFKPKTGVLVKSGVRAGVNIGQASNNVFYWCYFEGVPIGLMLAEADQQTFYGGSPEGCSTYGVVIGEECRYNTFIGAGIENIGAVDVIDNGVYTKYINCYVGNIIRFGAKSKGCSFESGLLSRIEILQGARDIELNKVTYNYFENYAKGLEDKGINTRYVDVIDKQTGKQIYNVSRTNNFDENNQYPNGNGYMMQMNITDTTTFPKTGCGIDVVRSKGSDGNFRILSFNDDENRLWFSKHISNGYSPISYLISNKDLATTSTSGIVKKAKSVDSNPTIINLISKLKEAGILE